MAVAKTERYPTTAIVLHWTIAALVFALVVLGWWMQEIPKQPPGPRADAFNLHKSFGLAALAFIAALIAWRLSHSPPPLPPMPPWQARLAKAMHLGLYVLIVAVAVSGYLGSAYSGYPVKFFGMTLPAWAASSADLKELMGSVHYWGSWLLTVAVLVHVGAVVKHTFVNRDALLRRMGWGAGRGAPSATSALREE
jgi:cytochrome b561